MKTPIRYYLAAPLYLAQWFIGVWLSEAEMRMNCWSRPKRGWWSDRAFDTARVLSHIRCLWINRAFDWFIGEDGMLCDCYDFEAEFEPRPGYKRAFWLVKKLTPRGWRKPIQSR